jgi:hypothetical protein
VLTNTFGTALLFAAVDKCRRHSFAVQLPTNLSIHKSLKLSSWVILLDGYLILSLLISSLLTSLGKSSSEFSLKLLSNQMLTLLFAAVDKYRRYNFVVQPPTNSAGIDSSLTNSAVDFGTALQRAK